jgi:glycosyltransferase involved in cell wall biosynthesis
MKEMASFIFNLLFHLRGIYKAHPIAHSIIFFSIPCGPVGLLLRLLFETDYVISLRGGDVPGTEASLKKIYWFLTPVRRLTLRFSRAVVANSQGLADLSRKSDPYPVRVIPNGVDTDFWCPSVKSVIDNAGHCFNILFVGRFHTQKNIRFLLREFKLFLTHSRAAKLTLVGDGPDLQSLHQYATELSIDGHIDWPGWVSKPRLKVLYQSTDCLVNPSLYEGMPNVLLEAMASGIPVIASNSIGNNEIIEDKVSGFLFQTGDSSDFQEKLQLVEKGGQEIQDIIARSRQKMVESHSWLSVAEQYVACFDECPC